MSTAGGWRIQRSRKRNRPYGLLLLAVLMAGYLTVAIYHSVKPLPEGLDVATPLRSDGDLRFLADYTWLDADGRRQTDHEIFDRVLALIEGAEQLLVLDMFLFNDFAGASDGADMRPLSAEVTAALIDKKRQRPDMPVILITDPINTLYGGIDNDSLRRLEAAGVTVVFTRLSALRDSNPTWSGLWRICCQWLGNSPGGWLPNPVGDEPVPLRSLLAMLNFKANHRKTLFADTPDGWTGLVTSGNPHDASSAHGNVAIEFTGQAALDLLASERAVVRFSATEPDWPDIADLSPSSATEPAPDNAGRTHIQILTEGAILAQILVMLDSVESGDSVDLAIFYLAQRDIVKALLEAHQRGVRVRVLLDSNQGAFGRDKNGVPNQPVARKLNQAGIPIRWCNTRGEQCHSKFILRRSDDGSAELIAGSANFTRRNLENLNLETNVRVLASQQAIVMQDAGDYFDRRWENRPDKVFSRPYSDLYQASRWRYWQYRFMEATGLSTF
jgi:phosphatidylserine/phosphatidylglycerophosphate/cardiolipin synthase-like enzyme